MKKFVKRLRKTVFKPVIKACFMRLIVFYQKHFSRHTCLYQPTCSEYMKRSINNKGVILGLLFGTWRILRCNPLSKGGYDPEPERYFRKKWVL
ncbi:MAG: membrane protein insertion efficiency factor YidD [Clostridia bacterium]|nr:membrane protein insertion efficiency factor YidD [Clostridia bacterium]